MRPPLALAVCIASWLAYAAANVEKAVFVVPSSLPPAVSALPSLDPRLLEHLSPSRPSLRRQLHAAFAHSPAASEPPEAWILLDDLTPGQRHEVRICWSAIQPADFNLSVHEPSAVAAEPALAASLQRYLDRRVATGSFDRLNQSLDGTEGTLLFHVSVVADYFSDDPQLMSDGLLLTADIILDPFFLNVLPVSLIPTTAYLLVLGVASWFVSAAVVRALHLVGTAESSPTTTNADKKVL